MTDALSQSLGNIQGNIIAPFNKPCQHFLFLNFDNNATNARDWLSELVGKGFVASTEQVENHRAARKDAGSGSLPTPVWRAVSFTSSALVTLDVERELATDLVTFDAFWRGALADRAYRAGGRIASAAQVGDPRISDPGGWVVGGPGQPPVDVLLTIAADEKADVERELQVELDRANRHHLVVIGAHQDENGTTAGEYGERLEGGTEHFGFRDGISQPGVRGFSTARTEPGRRRESVTEAGTPIIAAGEFVLGYERERGSYPVAARPDPPARMRDGSFQVFLRLTQDVPGWRSQMGRLRGASKDRVDVDEKVIGRTRKGRPLAFDKNGDLNDFTYDDDPQGLTTPRFSHIRTMNPRDKGAPDGRTHWMLRRGIPFGPPLFEDAEDDGVERGLLFNAFMASIEDQFEYIQRDQASPGSPAPLGVGDGPDPVVGASNAPNVLRREGKEPVEINFGRFVRTTGAVYAFAPSLPELRRLAGLES